MHSSPAVSSPPATRPNPAYGDAAASSRQQTPAVAFGPAVHRTASTAVAATVIPQAIHTHGGTGPTPVAVQYAPAHAPGSSATRSSGSAPVTNATVAVSR